MKIRNVFVRFKGFYEGMYKGFYRNEDNLNDIQECLGEESYEALNVIASAVDKGIGNVDVARELMALTAVVRVWLDNEKYCHFDQMAMDITTFCFINDCSWFNLGSRLFTNWAEAVYSFNMIWTTIVSSAFWDYSLSNDYNFYYPIG